MQGENPDKEAKQIWDELGPWWDASVKEGDPFHRAFIFPVIERWLNLKGGERILDAGCGNGALSRRMAKQGAEVYGVDFSRTLLNQAVERSQNFPNIRFEEVDLTDATHLKRLAAVGKFDRIISSMVLHNMSNLHPFFKALRGLLKPQGYFIFSIPHPCFNSSSVLFKPEGGLTLTGYIQQTTNRMRSKPGQPIEQLVFHRPVREYFNLLIDQGLVMNGFEEPCVAPKLLPKGNLWGQRPSIPPVLLARWVMT